MERIVYDRMQKSDAAHLVMSIHLHAYAFAHQYLLQKTVLDAACGTGFGSLIYSTAAKSIIGVDRSRAAIDHGRKLPFFCPTKFLVRDLETQKLPSADICVSIETIEHLNGDGFFLRNLDVGSLIFSVPIDMKSGYHKLHFLTVDDVSKHFNKHGWRMILAVNQKRQVTAMTPMGLGGIVSDTILGVCERT